MRAAELEIDFIQKSVYLLITYEIVSEIAVLTVTDEQTVFRLKERHRKLVYSTKLQNGADLMDVGTEKLIVIRGLFLKMTNCKIF